MPLVSVAPYPMSDIFTSEPDPGFRRRLICTGVFVLLCFIGLVIRLISLQVVNYDRYMTESNDNRISVIPLPPERGTIMDRNGVVLARNLPSYTLEIAPAKLDAPVEEVISRLAQVVPITPTDIRHFYQARKNTTHFQNVPLLLHLDDTEVARFAAESFRFPGVELQARNMRQYPLGETTAPIIGYVGKLSAPDQERINADSDANDADAQHFDPRRQAGNYRGTVYIGKDGIEQSYETQLHGLSGNEQVEVTASGHLVRELSTTPTIPGANLKLTIDSGLQSAALQAFAGRRGALVAIEPDTGEILAFVSSPSFDPNLFVNGIDQDDWNHLNQSADRPLLNRPLRGTYAPGSTYKPFMALAALTLHARSRNWGMQDPGFFMLGGHKFRNDVITGQGWIDMYRSIVVSNDTYYFMLAHDLGVDNIAGFMTQWGFGQKTGIDIAGEATGVLPSTQWKRQRYRSPAQQHWYEGETVSLGIGQGYNAFTIVQLAHAMATLANGGTIITPHLVREIDNPRLHSRLMIDQKASGHTQVSSSDIAFVKQAMVGVVTEGSAKAVFADAPYSVGAKTGTAQVVSIAANAHYHANALPTELQDNSLFEAFAPAEHPTIALAVVVENGGWGAQVAGPLARKVLDYYLLEHAQPASAAKEAAAVTPGTELAPIAAHTTTVLR
jgi:penicillin-binding protein 2